MTARIYVVILSFYLVTVALGSCSDNNNLQATVNFFNESSFKVDIYKNFNPDYFDPTTLVCTVNAGDTHEEKIYASADQIIGDTFYLHYKVPLANRDETGTTDIYVDAERNLSNISFVIEGGKTYTKIIPQPSKGELKFLSGIIILHNLRVTQVQIINGDHVLDKMDDKSVYLHGLGQGYYEIHFSSYMDTITMDHLKAFGNIYENFPTFVMERGKKYKFNIKDNGIEGPIDIKDIDPTK